MSAVVEVAWIGVGGVAVGGLIAITGTLVNGRVARQAAETTTKGAHRQRLWEKQSSAYEAVLKEVLARRTRREVLTSRGDVGNIGSHPRDEMQRAENDDSIQLTATLRAYASDAVWAAYERADEANRTFWLSLSKLASAQMSAERREGPSSGSDYQDALDAMNLAKNAAVAADESFFEATNRELAWRPAAQPTRP